MNVDQSLLCSFQILPAIKTKKWYSLIMMWLLFQITKIFNTWFLCSVILLTAKIKRHYISICLLIYLYKQVIWFPVDEFKFWGQGSAFSWNLVWKHYLRDSSILLWYTQQKLTNTDKTMDQKALLSYQQHIVEKKQKPLR